MRSQVADRIPGQRASSCRAAVGIQKHTMALSTASPAELKNRQCRVERNGSLCR